MRVLVILACALVGCGSSSTAAGTYEAQFGAEIGAETAIAEASLRLFSKEVLPALHEMDTPLHPHSLGTDEQAASAG